MFRKPLCVAALSLFSVACAGKYLTPGGGIPLSQIDAADAAEAATRQPSPDFPLGLGVVRVQAPKYRSLTLSGQGGGRYTVVGSELLSDDRLKAFTTWPGVRSARALDGELLPTQLETLDDLRLAAAKERVDVLLVYTVDTQFGVGGNPVTAGQAFKLGKGDGATLTSKASAIYTDVRTGFTYGSFEAAVEGSDLAGAWGSEKSLDAKRLETERAAVEALLAKAQSTWAVITQRYR